MARTLTINPAPFTSSKLALPPSPFSPREPITPPPTRRTASTSPNPGRSSDEASPPPPTVEPLHWLWQCHICNRLYRLGVTRRCLDDGHHFCAGTTTTVRSKKSNKKVVRHKACASEFDYAGWKAWGVWRREVAAEEDAWKRVKHKDCWMKCDYPSECRWGKQYGVQTPVSMKASVVPSTTSIITTPLILVSAAENDKEKAEQEKEEEEKSNLTFDSVLSGFVVSSSIADPSSEQYLEPLTPQPSSSSTTTSPPLPLLADDIPTLPLVEPQTKKPSMDDLLEGVKRRKRRSAGPVPSPLGSNPPSRTTTTTAAAAAAAAAAKPAQDATTIVPSAEPLSSASHLHKTFDDFELDFRRSMERASGLVTGWVGTLRSSSVGDEEEKADVFGKAVRSGKRK